MYLISTHRQSFISFCFFGLALALFEDSGWYTANYTKSSVSPWGHGAGCDFVRKPCLTKGPSETTVPDYGRGYFCTKSDQRGCSPSHHYKMGCTVLDYSLYPEMWLPPPRFQYFADEHMGGLSQADYCPVYGSGYRANIHDLDCRGSSSELINFYGEAYGAESMCFESTSGTGRCYKHKCHLEIRKLYIYVNFGWQQCTEDFAEIKIDKNWAEASIQSTVTCPRLTSACPDMFCPVNCAGRGDCNWDFLNENGTVAPKCECFNTSDTSAACEAPTKRTPTTKAPTPTPGAPTPSTASSGYSAAVPYVTFLATTVMSWFFIE